MIPVLAFAHATFCYEPKWSEAITLERPDVVYENPIEKMQLMTKFRSHHSLILKDFQGVPIEIVSYAQTRETLMADYDETELNPFLEKNLSASQVRSRSFTPEFFTALGDTFSRVKINESSAIFQSLEIGSSLSLKFDPESPQINPFLDNPGLVSFGLWVGSEEQVRIGASLSQSASGLGQVFEFKTTAGAFLISFVTIEGVNFELIHKLN